MLLPKIKKSFKYSPRSNFQRTYMGLTELPRFRDHFLSLSLEFGHGAVRRESPIILKLTMRTWRVYVDANFSVCIPNHSVWNGLSGFKEESKLKAKDSLIRSFTNAEVLAICKAAKTICTMVLPSQIQDRSKFKQQDSSDVFSGQLYQLKYRKAKTMLLFYRYLIVQCWINLSLLHRRYLLRKGAPESQMNCSQFQTSFPQNLHSSVSALPVFLRIHDQSRTT